jgi:ABC-2 type transport system ATP-binding protein
MKLFDLFKSKQIKYAEEDVKEYNSMKNKPMLFVRNLTKKYPGRKAPAIQNLSINVYKGQFHAFIGANGAGKTTTIKSLIGAYAN